MKAVFAVKEISWPQHVYLVQKVEAKFMGLCLTRRKRICHSSKKPFCLPRVVLCLPSGLPGSRARRLLNRFSSEPTGAVCNGAAEACLGATRVVTSDEDTGGIGITGAAAFGMIPGNEIGMPVVGGGMAGIAIGNPAIGIPITPAIGVAIDIIRGIDVELRFQPHSPSP